MVFYVFSVRHGMIERTFQILPSVSVKRESSIWNAGIGTWNEFIDTERIKGIPEKKKPVFDGILEEAGELLRCGDSRSLGIMLPHREHWRMYDRFKNDTAFFDIETDGLDRDSTVTVVTVVKGGKVTTLIEGEDLDAESLSDALDDPSMLVTFNGSCFDIPVLKYSFPGIDFNVPHFDLRFGCKRAGYSGGLKNIECQLGFKRDDDVKDIDGFEAVRLWKQWTRAKDRRSLDLLVEYNVADTVNLRTLADMMYAELRNRYV